MQPASGARERGASYASLTSADFERRTGEAIADIERATAAEIVVVVAPSAGRHGDVPLLAALLVAFVVFAVLVFVEVEVGDYTLFAAPPVAFGGAFCLVRAWPGLERRLLGARRRAQAAEVWARATFQKAGLHRTRDATAVLVFVSLLEGACVLVRDHGVGAIAADDEWRTLEGRFAAALRSARPQDELLSALRAMGRMLAERLPPRPDDIDELPSHVRVTF
jgi:putative membrane protein